MQIIYGTCTPLADTYSICLHVTIEILTLTNWCLGILEGILWVTYKSVPGWSPGSDTSGLKVPDIIFGIRIEIHMLSYI